MLFVHAAHPGRGVRLGYCMNLHPAEDLDGVLDGMRRITLPLRERLGAGATRDGFGVGMWLPASVAMALTAEEDSGELDRLIEFVVEEHLDPFTFNAFPYGGFHEPGLKERVFRPTWLTPERMAYTISVAGVALAIRAGLGRAKGAGHVSISTHTGLYGAWVKGPEDLDGCAESFALTALNLSQLEDETGERVVLSLEPEPRSLANDTRDLPGFFERIRARAHEVLGRGYRELRQVSEDIVQRHLGVCLDTCHAAVEFEEPNEALARATASGTALGKVQFSSALALRDPGRDAAARAALFAMAEPVYLHQVTGSGDAGLVRAPDLPALAAIFDGDSSRSTPQARQAWESCQEWRCHFHVPVDLGAVDGAALATTRAAADATLGACLADPERWGTRELHLEIETYTLGLSPELRPRKRRLDRRSGARVPPRPQQPHRGRLDTRRGVMGTRSEFSPRAR